MRRNGLFWGVLVIILGFSLLLQNMGLISGNFWMIFWPLVLIAFGAYVIFGPMLFRRTVELQNLSIPLEGAASAEVEFRHGAGRLVVDSAAEPGTLLSGSFGGGVESQVNKSGSDTRIKLRSPHDLFINIPWDAGINGLDWNVHLTKEIPLRVSFGTGASESDIDLRDSKVSRLDLDSGASKTRITMPTQAGVCESHIKTGAASLEIIFPEGVAGRIRVQSGLSNIMIDPARFPFNGSTYETQDFNSSVNRVDVSIETGVGRIVVR